MNEYEDIIADDDQPKEPFRVVATKIERREAQKLDRIADIQGTSVYEIIQNLVGAFIRLCDPGCVITDDLNRMRIAFELDTDFLNRMNLTDATAKVTVQEATYFLGDDKKKGMRLVHVYKPFFGSSTMTENTTEILERTLCEMNSVFYRKIRTAMARLGCTSIMDFLLRVVNETDGIDDANEFERLFADVRKNDFGREMADAPYRRTMNNSISGYEERSERSRMLEEFERRQTSLNFDDDGTQ